MYRPNWKTRLRVLRRRRYIGRIVLPPLDSSMMILLNWVRLVSKIRTKMSNLG